MSRKRWIWIGAPVIIILILASVGFAMRDQIAYARVATGYAAKETCSCLHVSGRTLDSCMGDFPAEARNNITIAAEGDTVRASVLFGAIASAARYEAEYGCAIIQ
ncbi:MAG: hypothetical protein AB7O98_03590 [Hyphomonadaceae bacterium]